MIFYFSATGNTRWVAQRIASSTQDHLISIAEAFKTPTHYELKEGERLGFIFPIHGWRVPILVRHFIKQLNINSEGHFTYAVCTCGDDIGLALDDFIPIHVDSAYSLRMPNTYVGLPFMDVDSKELQIQKKSQTEQRLHIIMEEIYDKKKEVFRLDRGQFARIKSHIIGGFFEKILISDKPFHVDANRCVKCGICANVCPVNDIEGGFGKMPEWKHTGECLTCFNCYHHCPHHAIEFGNRTKKKGQYYFK